MIKINAVPNNYEPRNKIIPKLKACPQGFRAPDMSDNDSAFLCGALKTFPHKKILEVGVSSGTTTAIILQALEDIGSPYEMHSVDLSEVHYFDKTKSTGWMAVFAKENNLFHTPPRLTLCGNHEFYIGKYLPQVIDKIGGDIDFVILDTVHYTPGELLDLLAMLPYLKDEAIVVLHDISLNQKNYSWHKPDCYATGLLFSSVVSKEKFFNYEQPRKIYPNIGAFRISKGTRANIENVFLALMLTWHYLPDDNEVKIYRDFYNRHYPAKFVEIFDECVRLNRGNVAFAEKK